MRNDAERAETPTSQAGEADARSLDLTACDREPIHLSGAIQPHGLMLIAEREGLRVVGGAGEIERRLAPAWMGRPLAELLAQSINIANAPGGKADANGLTLATVPGRGESFDAVLHSVGDHLIVELEPRPDIPSGAAAMLSRLDSMGGSFERAPDLISLCERASIAFRELTGFDRVMVYRFLDDGAGIVLAEDRDRSLPSFLNHHFPASDIPKQARALYVRNRVRVIPDVSYVPQPIRPDDAGLQAIDLSDCALRSVSPIHVQYLRNMGVGASASVSIVKDGLLWGLIACHHQTPRRLSHETRIACQALAGALARQIRAKEEAEAYRERIRLRSAQDMLIAQLNVDHSFSNWFDDHGDEFRSVVGADGFAAVRGQSIAASGITPTDAQIRALAQWLDLSGVPEPLATAELGAVYTPAQAFRATASGLITTSLPREGGTRLLWFRVEEPDTVAWAGNPHKDVQSPTGQLTPRASFEAWREDVCGRSRRWTPGEIDAVAGLRRTLTDLRQGQRLRELNRQLGLSVAEKEVLIQEKDQLLLEVNHRIQNSLQLVQAFLSLQANASKDPVLSEHLGEAQRRLSAVALVHRRLYQANQIESVDLARYLEELIGDIQASLGPDWQKAIRLDLSPVLIKADRAVHVGLILTELVINANKYAYNGAPGPLSIALEEHRDTFRLIVADNGSGKVRTGVGFGTRMMDAMVQRLNGTIEQSDNQPGLRVIVTAPVDAR